MLIREYKQSDLEALRRMHASQGFDYPFPDLDDPIFVSKLVLEGDDGRPAMASLARLTCEMYLLMDRDGVLNAAASPRGAQEEQRDSSEPKTPLRMTTVPARHTTSLEQTTRQRYEWLLALHATGERDLLARGLDDAHAWLPPPIAKRFGRRLEALGWVRDDAWTPFCRRLNQ